MAWTDERLDDVFTRIDRNFERVFDEFRATRTEMRDEFRAIRGEIAADRRQHVQMMWGIWALLIIQIVASVAVR